ncbi:MAG: PAS domain-containing protein, partial [Desulfuromonadales bacterium]|nr:PAS domain-containing protein [Desulfuromonadales bacterium]
MATDQEQTRLAQELAELRQLFAALVENSPVGIAVVGSRQLRVKWGNEAYRQGLNHPEEHPSLNDLPLEEIVPGADASGLADLIRQVAASGHPYVDPQYRLTSFTRGETWWQLALVPIPGAEAEPEVMMLALDVSQAVAARRAAEEEGRRLRAILDHTPSAIYLKDLQGRLILVNQVMEKIFARPAEWFLGQDASALFATRDLADEVRANDQQVLQTGTPMSFEEVVLQEDGPHTYISTKFPLRDAEGGVYALGGISTD